MQPSAHMIAAIHDATGVQSERYLRDVIDHLEIIKELTKYGGEGLTTTLVPGLSNWYMMGTYIFAINRLFDTHEYLTNYFNCQPEAESLNGIAVMIDRRLRELTEECIKQDGKFFRKTTARIL